MATKSLIIAISWLSFVAACTSAHQQHGPVRTDVIGERIVLQAQFEELLAKGGE